MAVELAHAFIGITPSFKGMRASIDREFGGVERSASSAGDRIGRNLGGGFADSFKKIAAPALAIMGAGAIANFAKTAVAGFSELEDSTAAASVVFGASMQKIISQSAGASKNLGLTEQQVINAANTFGTYGKAAGLSGDALANFATEQTALAADMASFKGTSPEQAIEAIGAALRGETEPIRAYGVMLDDASLRNEALAQGLISTTKDALTPQQKTLAAQALILKQTADAQGDFARTQDSTANIAKTLTAETADLSAKMGSVLAPAFTAARTAAIGAVGGVSGILDKVVAFQGTLASGGNTLDLVRAIGLNPENGFGAVVKEGIGSIRAFGAAWKANDGDITSSGLAGFMEQAAFKIRQGLEGILPVVTQLGPPFLALLAAVSPVQLVFQALLPVLPQLTSIIGQVAVIAGQLATVIANGLTIALQVLAPVISGLLTGFAGFISGITSSETGVTLLMTALSAAAGVWLLFQGRILATTIATNAHILATNAQALAAKAAAAGQWLMNAALTANPIGIVVAAVAALVGGLVYFFTQTETGRKVIEKVWGAIKSFIGGVADWFRSSFLPGLQVVFNAVGSVFSFLYNNVVKPVFDGIKWFIGAWWTVVSGIFQVVVALVKNVLGPVFTWLHENIIKPVWNGIQTAISAVWKNFIRPVFDAIGAFIRNILAPAFTWFRDNVIRPVWDWISSKISGVWNDKIRPVFDALKRGVEALPAAFDAAKNGIGTAWDAIREAVKKPIRGVIGFINEGLIDRFNTIPGVSIKHLRLPPGFRKGGYTGDGRADEFAGHVHKGEYVFTKAQTAALGKERLAAMAHAAVRGGAASVGEGNLGGFFQGNANAIARHGAYYMDVAGGMGGWNFGSAARMWDGAAGVKVAVGRGSLQGRVTPLERGGGILGYTTGNNIDMSPSWMARLGPRQRTTVAAHEVGHALGLPHNSMNSIMQPNLANMAAAPTAVDIRNLQRLYPGGSGKAGDGSVENPFDGLVDALVGKLKAAFPGGGMFLDAAGGLAKQGIGLVVKMVTDIKNGLANLAGDVFGKVKDFFGGGAVTAPTLYDQGGVLPSNGGRPFLVQNKTRRPEAVFTDRQLAERDARNSGGPAVVNNYHGPVGFDPEELARKQEITRRRAQTMAGMDGVVFA
jgi:hypothetical protein